MSKRSKQTLRLLSFTGINLLGKNESNCYAGFHVSKITDVPYNRGEKNVTVGLFKQVLYEKTSHGSFSSAFGNSWKVASRRALTQPPGHPVVSWD